uniref:Uncharacterized protein n=1 Tax=Arundo donax TaxID=35708 RepID=A0A0A9GGX9_ARUDO
MNHQQVFPASIATPTAIFVLQHKVSCQNHFSIVQNAKYRSEI